MVASGSDKVPVGRMVKLRNSERESITFVAMNAWANLMEAARFAVDQAGTAKDPDTGRSVVSIGLQAASMLVRIQGLEDQKVLMAAMLYLLPEEHCPVGQVEEVFGLTVAAYLQASRDPEQLRIPPLQRLQAKKQRETVEAARSIRMAIVVAQLSQPVAAAAKERLLASVAAFSHTLPMLAAFLPAE